VAKGRIWLLQKAEVLIVKKIKTRPYTSVQLRKKADFFATDARSGVD